MLEQSVSVVKADLLAKLVSNRAEHEAAYEEAAAGYRAKAVETLRTRADGIEAGGKIDLSFQLPKPESHLDDYDEAIAMVEWHDDDYMDLDYGTFRNWVLNKWHWDKAFIATNSTYNVFR